MYHTVQAVFMAKIKKYQGVFLQVGGWVPTLKIHFFFRKYPLKEDKVFSESTSPPLKDPIQGIKKCNHLKSFDIELNEALF